MILVSETNSPVVLITGAAAGMGLTTANLLLARGYRVIAIDIDDAKLGSVLGAYGDDQVFKIKADLSKPDEAVRAVRAGIDHFGKLNALINNAALHGKDWNGPCLDVSREDWERIFAVNVLAIPLLVGAAFPALAESKGVVINMSSMVGYGFGPSSPYAVSKAAVNGMTTSLAVELGPHGIRVVGVAPGFITTPTSIAAVGDQAAQERLLSLQAMPEYGTPEDISEILEFLISPRSRIITGTTVIADLGITRRP